MPTPLKPNSVIVTTFTPEQYAHWFNRKNANPSVVRYLLVRLIAPRKGPGTNCFLLVPHQDPVRPDVTFVMWNVMQVPTDPRNSATSGCYYHLEDDEGFTICTGPLERILGLIAEEHFYECMEFHIIDDLEQHRFRSINPGRYGA